MGHVVRENLVLLFYLSCSHANYVTFDGVDAMEVCVLSAKLHYTPYTHTGYGRHQRKSSQQFYKLLYNKVTTNGQKFATSQHLDMSRFWALALRCGKFVVELLICCELVRWWCPLVMYNMSVAGVRVVEFGPYCIIRVQTMFHSLW